MAGQQWRERLDRAATSAADELAREVDGWMSAIDRLDTTSAATGAATAPDSLRRAMDAPGVAVVRIDGAKGATFWPERALAYAPRQVAPRGPGAQLQAIETLELHGKSSEAIAGYRQLLTIARGDDRTWVLHRLARAQRKAGQLIEASRSLDDLERQADTHVAGLPADFLARYERAADVNTTSRAGAALSLLRDLGTGRWLLEEPRYRHYVSRLREWASVDSAAATSLPELDRIRARREALTTAALAPGDVEPVSDYLTLFGRSRSATAARVTLLIERTWVIDHLLTRTRAVASTVAALRASVGAGSDASARTARPPDPFSDLRAGRTVRAAGVVWTVDVWPDDPGALFADVRRRQFTYLALLVGVVGLMGFGSYLTARVVRREMEIARMKADFVAAVSHEFRSPLTGIRQLGEMLARGRVPNEARRQEYYERITRESDRLSRIVENLLDFSRMEEGRRPYRFERVETRDWLEQTVAEFTGQGAHRAHRVVTDIDDELPALVIDREALTTAVDNLLDNAAKYSPGADTIWLDAKADGAGMLIRVRDRGIGIAAADQARVFDRFFRGSQNGTARVPGTGLGLSLVRHIVQAHGGRVSLESEPGAGTTVSVHLEADR